MVNFGVFRRISAKTISTFLTNTISIIAANLVFSSIATAQSAAIPSGASDGPWFYQLGYGGGKSDFSPAPGNKVYSALYTQTPQGNVPGLLDGYPVDRVKQRYDPKVWVLFAPRADGSDWNDAKINAGQYVVKHLIDDHIRAYLKRQGVTLDNAPINLKVQAIMAAIRFQLEENNTFQGPGDGKKYSNRLMAEYQEWNLTGKIPGSNSLMPMLEFMNEMYQNRKNVGWGAECTEFGPVFAYFLNAYVIPARAWDVVMWGPQPPKQSYTSDGCGLFFFPSYIQRNMVCLQSHYTTEYWDAHLMQWVFADATYGISSFYLPAAIDQCDSGAGSPENLQQWLSAIHSAVRGSCVSYLPAGITTFGQSLFKNVTSEWVWSLDCDPNLTKHCMPTTASSGLNSNAAISATFQSVHDYNSSDKDLAFTEFRTVIRSGLPSLK